MFFESMFLAFQFQRLASLELYLIFIHQILSSGLGPLIWSQMIVLTVDDRAVHVTLHVEAIVIMHMWAVSHTCPFGSLIWSVIWFGPMICSQMTVPTTDGRIHATLHVAIIVTLHSWSVSHTCSCIIHSAEILHLVS